MGERAAVSSRVVCRSTRSTPMDGEQLSRQIAHKRESAWQLALSTGPVPSDRLCWLFCFQVKGLAEKASSDPKAMAEKEAKLAQVTVAHTASH